MSFKDKLELEPCIERSLLRDKLLLRLLLGVSLGVVDLRVRGECGSMLLSSRALCLMSCMESLCVGEARSAVNTTRRLYTHCVVRIEMASTSHSGVV
jgi:hypothetical protein